jgi:hypothetical protein
VSEDRWLLPPEGRLVITRADPQLSLSHEMFGWLLVDEVHPDVEFTPGPDGAYQGSIIKIRALNGTFIYRVERFLDHQRGWLISWPD